MKQFIKLLQRCVPAFVLAVAFVIPLAVPARAVETDVYQANAYTSYDGSYHTPGNPVEYLSDIEWVYSHNHTDNSAAIRDGTFKDDKLIWLGGASAPDSLVTDGVLFSKGLGVSPGKASDGKYGASETVFNLSGLGATNFYSVVGITNVKGQNYAYGDDVNGETFKGAGVIFQVYGDYVGDGTYQLLSESEHITKTMTGEFNVDITGVKYLKLVVKCYSDAYGANWSMNSAWGNACVYDFSLLPIDYNDYLDPSANIDSLDGNDICTSVFPTDWTLWELNEMDDEAVYDEVWGYSELFNWEHTGNDYGTVSFTPLGNRVIDMSYIPTGSLVVLGVMMDYTTSFVDVTATALVNYYDKDMNYLDTSWDTDLSISNGERSACTLNLDYPYGAKYFSVTFEVYSYSPGYMTEAYMYLADFDLTLTVPSSVRVQQQLDKNNAQLEDVGDKLEDLDNQQQQTNDKLDEIIDSTVAPESPDGDDTVNDYGDLEEGIMNDMSSNFSDADGYLTSATEIISKYGTALLAVSHLFGIFWKFPFFAELVMVAFAFGMFGTLLGVGFGAISAHNAKVERANRQNRKGG